MVEKTGNVSGPAHAEIQTHTHTRVKVFVFSKQSPITPVLSFTLHIKEQGCEH